MAAACSSHGSAAGLSRFDLRSAYCSDGDFGGLSWASIRLGIGQSHLSDEVRGWLSRVFYSVRNKGKAL